jgi:hypothetical protein
MKKAKSKKFDVLKLDIKNKNHHIYNAQVVNSWINSDRMKPDDSGNIVGYDIECSIDEEGNFEVEYAQDEMIIGRVIKLEIKDSVLIATCEFKTDGDAPYMESINSDDSFLDKCSITPKSKAAVRNYVVQDDCELICFNLMWSADSSFIEEVPETTQIH